VNNPRQPDLLYSAGLLAFQLNDLPTARTELEGALVGRYPDADFLRYSLGQISEGLKDAEAARHWYAQVGPGVQYLPAQVRLAFLDAQNGQVDAGLGRLAKLGSNDAERVQLVLIQSEMAREAKRYARADALLTKALRRYPRTPELLYERSLARDLLNQTAAAERDLRSLLKIRPRDEQALNALGYILANRTTRYDEAYGLISRALKLAPDNPMIIDSMGWVLYRQGHPDQALPYLTRAYAVLPDQEVAAHYGEVLWKLGRQQEARELWAKAAALPGEHPELDEASAVHVPAGPALCLCQPGVGVPRAGAGQRAAAGSIVQCQWPLVGSGGWQGPGRQLRVVAYCGARRTVGQYPDWHHGCPADAR